jgi:hypothetical protein
MFDRQKKFRMEKLEDRQMMAGDIAVSFSNGLLSITEAVGHEGEDNTVAVSMEANGNLRVFGGGVDQQFDATLVENIDILLGMGSDTLVFSADLTEPGVPDYGTCVFINMGTDGYDYLGDLDQVEITGSDIQGLVHIEGSRGDDRIYVNNTTIMGDGLMINTGNGTDVVEVTDCVLSGLAIQTDQGYYGEESDAHNDRVEIRNLNVDQEPVGLVKVRMGAGADVFHLENVNAVNVDINAGGHNDIGTLIDVAAVDELMVRMGEGDDTLVLRRIQADHFAALGEDGTRDQLDTRGSLDDRNIFNTSDITGWETIDGVRRVLLTRETMPKKMLRRPMWNP